VTKFSSALLIRIYTENVILYSKSMRFIFVLMAVLSMALTDYASAESVNTKNFVYLFSFFRDNGQDGLYLAWSRDGLKWSEITPPGKSFLAPTVGGKIMRDPCLRRGPDGTFRLVWTTGWARPSVFGYACSTNLIDWSDVKAVPVMENEAQARNVWAPELFYDTNERKWLIFWASTIPGRFPETDKTGDDGYNHRIYYTATDNFQNFTPTGLFFNDGFNVIDATLIGAKGKYYLIVKDETLKPVKKNLRISVSKSPEGPFKSAGSPFTTNWVEGPSAIQIGNHFYVYFDHYTNPQYYGAMESTDMEHWTDVSEKVSFPKGTRHGTALAVPESVVQNLIQPVSSGH